MPQKINNTELNHKSYFTLENQYLSNSKIQAFLKDKKYFHDLYVSGKREKEVTDAMIIGKALDMYVTVGAEEFNKTYTQVVRRSTKDPDYEYQLNETMYSAIMEMVGHILASKAYQELVGYERQRILKVSEPIGQFDGLCGIPDFFTIDDNKMKVIIVDLKSSADANPKKYYWKCLDFGYFMQLATYEMLIRANYQVKDYTFEFRHLLLEKDSDDINRVYPFVIDPLLISQARVQLINTIELIKAECEKPKVERWQPINLGWNDATLISNWNEND